MEVRHGWNSAPHWLENVASLVFGSAFLVGGAVDVGRREVSGGWTVFLVLILFTVPIVGLAVPAQRLSGWWRRGRLIADPAGLTLVDRDGAPTTIAREDLQVHRYSVTFTGGEGGASTAPFVVVDGAVTPWALDRDAWPLHDAFWRAMDVEPGPEREVQEWDGLARHHPGVRRFGTGDTGFGLTLWMFGCFVWTLVVVGLAVLEAP